MFREYKSDIEKKFFEMCTNVVNENGYKLYDLEYISGSTTLRVYICGADEITADIKDCVKVDSAMTPFIEEADWIPETLILEVSSPGMYRQLTSPWHLETVKGNRVKLATKSRAKEYNCNLPKKLLEGKSLVGVLNEYNDNNLSLDISGVRVDINLGEIKKANLEPEL